MRGKSQPDGCPGLGDQNSGPNLTVRKKIGPRPIPDALASVKRWSFSNYY